LKLTQIVLLLFMGLVGYGLGRKIWRLLGVGFNSFLEEIVFSLSLGWGALAYLVLGLGVGRLLYRGVAYGLLALLTLIVLPEIKAFIGAIGKRLTGSGRQTGSLETGKPACLDSTKINRLFFFSLWLLLATTLVTVLIGALTPPLNYDTLSYHLGVPKEYIRYHKIVYLPHQVYSNFPFTLEMLYLLSLLLKGGILAKLVHLSFGLLTVATIYIFGRRYFNSRIALLASAIFFNIPLTGFLSTTAYIDLGAALYTSLALLGFVNWFYSRKREDFLISAIFTGLAMGTKYPAILFSFLPLLLGIILKTSLIDKVRWPVSLKKALIFSLVAIGTVSPWLIKNFIYTGNPIYPLFYNFLGGRGWNAFNAARFMAQHSAPFPHWWGIFTVPLAISKSKDIGPLFIIFVPLLVFFKQFAKPIKLLLIYGGVYFLLWAFFTQRDYRFLLPAFPAISLVVAYLMKRFGTGKGYSLLLTAGLGFALALDYQRFHLFGLQLLKFREGLFLIPLALGLSTFIVFIVINCAKRRSLSPLLVSGLALVFLLNLATVMGMVPEYGLLKVALNRESQEAFLSRTFYAYDAFRFANEKLPSSAKLLLIGENQGYYLDRDFVANSPLDDNIIVGIVNSSRNGEEIKNKLKDMGITYILYNASEVKRVSRDYDSFNWADEKARKRFLRFFFSGEYLKLIFSRNGVFIYKIL